MQTKPTNDTLITQLFDALPESVLWFKPVYHTDNSIIDFEVAYCNDGATRFLKTTKAELMQSRVLHNNLVPEHYKKHLFEKCLSVWETGEAHEESAYLTTLERYFNVLRSKVMDGVVSITRDRTEFYKSEQERQQQTDLVNGILDASLNGIFYSTAVRNDKGEIVDLKFVKINRGFTQLLRKTEEEVIGKNYLTFFPKANDIGLFDLNRQVIETGRPQRKEIYYDGDGLQAWYEVSLVKLGRDGLVVNFTDITNSRQNQNAIQQSEARLRSIINTSQSGMFTLTPIKDKNGEVVDFCFGIVNEAVAAYIGQTADVLTGALASSHFPAYQTNGLFNIYKDTFLTGQVHQFDFHYEDGYDVYFNIHTIKTGDEVLVTFTDHTALKKLQVQLEQSIEDLQRSNANLQEFAYAASHDLQEPLRKVHFFAERLQASMAPLLKEEDRKMFERMEGATHRMRNLIDDLLAYSKVSVATALTETVALQDVVQGALTDLETAITEKGATITTCELPVVKGDSVQLRQLFLNLLSNALKYSKQNTAPVITLAYQKSEQKLNGTEQLYHCIAVTDNGIGFEQQYAERIFQVFQRLHGKSEYPGTGVGLAIAQKVVINHHGYIKAKSQPGEGATFSIYLPV
jgi:signal transduction histidine kinase